MTRPDKKLLLLLGLAVVLLCGASFQYGRYLEGKEAAAEAVLANLAEGVAEVGQGLEPAEDVPEALPDPEPEPEPALIAVHVKGAVERPGLYELAEGSRVNDALAAAGLLAEANTDLVNLAATLSDGLEVVVPFRLAGEETDWEALATEVNTGAGTSSGGNGSSTASSGSSGGSAYTGMVNINTDSKARLESLNGIGPAKAQAIIDYRTQNGPFASIEQIKNVSGIGSATYDKIKDRICVE